jgi:hypothetical protein
LDYVVAGFGIGAIVALIGFALWELYGNSDEPGHGWLTRASIGAMLGSLVIWAVTGVTLISTLDDDTASNLVLATAVITILAIVAGTIWYWRADQALLASMPQPVARKSQEQAAAALTSTPTSVAGVELSEWDSWPDREDRPADSVEAHAQPDSPAEPSFEAEVAAKPAEAVSDSPSQAGETVEPEPERDEVFVVEDTVIAVAVDPELGVEPEMYDEADTPAGIDAPASEPAKPENVEEPEGAAEVAPPIAALPANIQPRRNSEADAGIERERPVNAGPPKLAVGDVTRSENATGAIDPAVANGTRDTTQPSNAPAPPAAFESSLLADIDRDSVEGDGRYRSPLLADLDKNPDELEGVGLAKWRPDARLTAEQEVESPSPAKRRKRR